MIWKPLTKFITSMQAKAALLKSPAITTPSPAMSMQYQPGSLMDRVADHIQFDLFWNNFSLIESIAEMKESYAQLVEKSDYYLIRENDNPLVKPTKVIATKAGRRQKTNSSGGSTYCSGKTSKTSLRSVLR